MTDFLIPVLLLGISIQAMRCGEDVCSHLISGGKEGLRLLITLLPTLVMLLTAVSMLRASGAIDAFSSALAPVMERLGIPPETAPLLLIRPVSGSAALALGTDLMKTYGVDSMIGRTAAVMLGSSETTFYAISIYCGSVGIRRTRYMVPAALTADLAGFLAAAWSVRLMG